MEGSPPKRAIVILMDSLNRHFIGPYRSLAQVGPVAGLDGKEPAFATPNLDRFAQRAVRFDHHVVGSLPCMPARHDILVGSLDFLWRPWGSVELWERPITAALQHAGIVTQLITDHPHLFETGGENYHTEFTAWDYQRGHESDPWKTRADPSFIGAPTINFRHLPYDDSRTYFRSEEEYPGPKTMAAAASWLDTHAPHHEEFLLFVDEFDPHEPFDTPEPYTSMYDDTYDGPPLVWPPYQVGAVAQGKLTPAEVRKLRANYGAKLTMIDHWFGRVLDAIDRQNLWDDTAVIVTTDHGHYLGEDDIFGKPGTWIRETLGHIPLLISWPGRAADAPRSISALTTNVDLHATLVDLFGVSERVIHRTHGHSLIPLLSGSTSKVRDWALSGVWGREVQLVSASSTAGVNHMHTYARAPFAGNEPLSMWSNRWSTMPIHGFPNIVLPMPDDRAWLDRMPGSSIPVIRQPFVAGDALPFWAAARFTGNHLHNVGDDPAQQNNLVGTDTESEMADLLRIALQALDAPHDQLERLGLA
jgi:arylsulfatase A-like enzyme